MAEAMKCDACGQIADKHAAGDDLVYGLNAFWPEEPQDGSRDAAWARSSGCTAAASPTRGATRSRPFADWSASIVDGAVRM